MRIGETLAIFFLLIGAGFGIYIMFEEINKETVNFKPVAHESIKVENIQKAVQFYPKMRYVNSTISYSIDSSCSVEKQSEVVNALSIISEKTVLAFVPKGEDSELKILCSEVSHPAEQNRHFIAGEGGPTIVLNTSIYYIIKEGKISLFKSHSCDSPIIALHEILHALGFDHTSDTNSIMYPVTACKQSLDQGIIDTINEIYSVKPLPDIALTELTANKTGRYLSFKVTVSNIGLVSVKDVELLVMTDNVEIKKFDINELNIAERKSLNVKNLKIPEDTQKVSFVINLLDNSAEISEDNNKVDLFVSSALA